MDDEERPESGLEVYASAEEPHDTGLLCVAVSCSALQCVADHTDLLGDGPQQEPDDLSCLSDNIMS